MPLTAAVAALAAAALAPAARAGAVSELHPESFFELVKATADPERPADTLVVFYDASPASAAALGVLEHVGARLAPTAVDVALYNHSRWGAPAGAHYHDDELPFVTLLRAGSEPVIYEWREEAGEGGGGGHHHHHHHDHDHDHDHDHEHDPEHERGHDPEHEHGHGHGGGAHGSRHHPPPQLTLPGVLAFLKRHSTFAAELPEPTLGERWAGREAGVFRAVAQGLEALRQRLETLQADNDRLRSQVAALTARCRGSGGGAAAGGRKARPPPPPPTEAAGGGHGHRHGGGGDAGLCGLTPPPAGEPGCGDAHGGEL